jgi:hypothetical protein
MTRDGFQQSLGDPCLFVNDHDTAELFVFIYVDELLVTGNDNDGEQYRTFVLILSTTFQMRD